MTAPLPADDRRPVAAVAIIGNDALLTAAPATPVQLAHACLRRGFTVAVPVTWGDELLAAETVRRLAPRARGPAVMCVCPFVRSRLLAPGPDLAPFLVSMVPPPVATARYLRTVYGDRGVHITYIGACPGAEDQAIDTRLTPDAFLGELAEHGISLAEQPLVFDSIVPPDRRRWCSLPGGVPSAEVLWSDTDARTLVEIDRDDVSTDLAQHIIARDHVLLDLAPSLGCSCSGAIPSLTPRSARVAVTALEPPRALGPVIEPTTIIALDAPVDGAPTVQPPLPVIPRTQQQIDYDARERALDMILGGEPEAPVVAAPSIVASPSRKRPPTHAEMVAPVSPAGPRRTDSVMIEPPAIRAEQPRMVSAMSPSLLETLIDDILIEPLIIPATRPAGAEAQSMSVAEPHVDRAPVRSASEVSVELDVVREVVAEAVSAGVRYPNGSTPTLTSAADLPERDAPHGAVAIEVEHPKGSDTPATPSNESRPDSETLIDTPTGASADLSSSVDDASTSGEGADDMTSSVRRRTPPAMPARHPASTVPKAVSANGRPLPRAYVAKRRVTPAGSTAISAVPLPAVEPDPVGDTLQISSIEASGAPVEASVAEAALTSSVVDATEMPALESLVIHAGTEHAPSFEAESDALRGSESVWGVTVEAPVVAKTSQTESSQPTVDRPIRLGSLQEDGSPESAAESQSRSVPEPSLRNNSLITIMVVALVTLAVSVFALLRR